MINSLNSKCEEDQEGEDKVETPPGGFETEKILKKLRKKDKTTH